MIQINTKNLKYIVLHHTECSYKVNPNQWQQTNILHKKNFNFISTLGFYGGYNYEIASDGTVKQFRQDGELTAAALGHNADSIHIALDGNFDIELPAPEQLSTLKNLLLEKMKVYNIPRGNIVLHRYFATTSLQSGKFIKNTTNWKTWDNCMPYKDCAGSKLSDDFGSLLVAPAAIPNQVSEVEVNQAISILERLIKILKDYLQSKKITGMPYYEQFSD